MHVLDLVLPALLALAAAYPLMLLWNDAKAPRVQAVVKALGTICDVVWGNTHTKYDRYSTRTMACSQVQAFMTANPRTDYVVQHRQVAMLAVTMPDGSVRAHEEAHIERMLHRSVKVGQRLELIHAGESLGFDAPMSAENRNLTLWIAIGLLTVSAAILVGVLSMRARNRPAPPSAAPVRGNRVVASSRR